jgi:hypothetical protein
MTVTPEHRAEGHGLLPIRRCRERALDLELRKAGKRARPLGWALPGTPQPPQLSPTASVQVTQGTTACGKPASADGGELVLTVKGYRGLFTVHGPEVTDLRLTFDCPNAPVTDRAASSPRSGNAG